MISSEAVKGLYPRNSSGSVPVSYTHLDVYKRQGEQFELCSCEDCGFTFTQGVPVDAEIGKYYETPDYLSHTETRKGCLLYTSDTE